MRCIWILSILCAFVRTGAAEESTRHAFSHATEDECSIEEIHEVVETKLVHSVKLICVDGPVTYREHRLVGDETANWPTLAWDDAKKGERVVCKLEHRPFGRDFFIVVRTFKNCERASRREAHAQ